MGMFRLLPNAEKIHTAQEAFKALEYLNRSELLSFDTETTGLVRPKDRAIILAISDGVRRFAIWPSAIPYFTDLLEDPSKTLIAHNANFDCWMLKNVGIHVYKNCTRTTYRIYDTMVMHALLNDVAAHDLKSNTKNYLGIEMVPFGTVFDMGRGKTKRSLEEVLMDPENREIVANYAALDAYATYHLFIKLRGYLQEQPTESEHYPTLWDYYYDTEFKYTKVLFDIELNGIRIDKEGLIELAPRLEKEMLDTQKWFGKQMGRLCVNPSSNKEMGDLFFRILGKQPFSLTPGGAPQLNKTTLQRWAESGCEFSQKLLRYRDLDKQLGTYVINLVDKVSPDGRIHASFNQTGARTGRLSSSDPNLQNQPPFIREAYIPSPGFRLMARDYAQLEMRILAHFSLDRTLRTAIINGLDIHASTASTMFKVAYEDIVRARKRDDADESLSDKEKELLLHRKAAKTINFGLMYGQGAGKLGGTLGIGRDEARKLIRRYFSAFPSITKYFDTAIAKAKETAHCSTLLGRRRLVPGLRSIYGSDIAEGERKVKNSPIQGTAAEIAKMAMIKIYEDPFITATGTKMLIQVHDEIVFEVPKELEHDEEFNQRIMDLMAHPFDFDLAVPLETSGKYGDNWLECK